MWRNPHPAPAAVLPGLRSIVPAGLPVGLQIVGRRNDELGVLQLAAAFENLTETAKKHPPIAD